MPPSQAFMSRFHWIGARLITSVPPASIGRAQATARSAALKGPGSARALRNGVRAPSTTNTRLCAILKLPLLFDRPLLIISENGSEFRIPAPENRPHESPRVADDRP